MAQLKNSNKTSNKTADSWQTDLENKFVDGFKSLPNKKEKLRYANAIFLGLQLSLPFGFGDKFTLPGRDSIDELSSTDEFVKLFNEFLKDKTISESEKKSVSSKLLEIFKSYKD